VALLPRPGKNSALIADTSSEKMKTILSAFISIVVLSIASYPQQKGVVEGRLVNRTDPALVARDVPLEIVGLMGGMSIIKSANTDPSGKFRIEGLPESEPLMIRANYKGANYHVQLHFNQTGKASVDLEIYEPTSSMAGISVDGIQMAFEAVEGRLISVETISFNNKMNPPRTYVNPEGSLRVSKAAGIVEMPKIRVTAPGSSMPLVQSALESPDGQSYYSQYPLRPGITTFEAQQVLPYQDRRYTFTKKFFQDVNSISIGVVPKDMTLSGQGLSKMQTDSDKNFSVYMSPPVKAGSEVTWNFSGGTIVEAPQQPSDAQGESNITAMPNAVGRNALIIGPLLLAGFIVVLWYAFNFSGKS
jgi:hypothetical protein